MILETAFAIITVDARIDERLDTQELERLSKNKFEDAEEKFVMDRETEELFMLLFEAINRPPKFTP
jgi:hypothetical protein